jgi:hypothetical protein
MRTGHRVQSKRLPKPPLPKEITPTEPRQYVDRWGVKYLVIWNGQPGDQSLEVLGRTEASS